MKKLKEIVLAEKISKLRIQKEKEISVFDVKISRTRCALLKVCTHSQTEEREDNREGGYDYRAEYRKITECKICGKELDRKTTYGGFA